MELTSQEQAYLDSIRHRLNSLKEFLNEQVCPESGSSAADWHTYLAAMKAIVGNASNDLSFVAGLMAKEYLSRKLPMVQFDAAAKAQGAPGLDIDQRTTDARRVIGEIKTTTPYMERDLGAQQRATLATLGPSLALRELSRAGRTPGS